MEVTTEAPPRASWWLVAGLLALLLVPLVVAGVALREPRWYPTLDLAMTELRVRDVGTADSPLIGLPGRIGPLERQGSHPGPLSFYALAPAYRVLGSSAWALEAGALVLTAAAMGSSVVLARRRGGPRLVAGVALLLALLGAAYGFQVLAVPWNPYLPVLWWGAFLLSCWSIAVRDLWVIPVAAAIGSLCAQTHLPYAGLTLGVGLGSLALAFLADRSPEGRRALVRPTLAAIAVAAVLWAPVALDQLTVDPGNATVLADHFLDPPEDPIGLSDGLRVALVHLDLTQLQLGGRGEGWLVDTDYDPEGSMVPGLVLLAVWGAAVAVAARARLRRWLQLDLVVAGALVLGVVSASNILGKVWYYLTLWAWVTTALLVLSILGTAAAVLEPRLGAHARARWTRASLAALVALVGVSSARLAIEATDAVSREPVLSEHLGLVVAPTAAALRSGTGAATGEEGRYVVTWSDPLYIGSEAFGLINELERDGFDVGVRDFWRTPVTPHRVIPPGEVDALVHFASGEAIDAWRDRPGVVEAVHVDPRTSAEREEYERIVEELTERFREQGADDLIPGLSGNVFGTSLDPRLGQHERDQLQRMLDLGLPISVFIAPPDADAP
jgi:hypothetical protein